ncbi:PIR Superfamily Protein [Plasmodium ovale curtisi]|uniref:PIR Superfamily Protein n=1 Tax=Plasmodium ovale curtisi TaxID=864141 RepID=A0A1A8WV22_PLAOA|nr:PIR Superfamily Protein [Plasmodium ovale curtisi]
MDIKKWKTQYPFLDDIWKLFQDFDRTVIEDNYFVEYEKKCRFILDGKNYHLDVCMKLLRNLWLITDDPYEHISENARCTYLNTWLYYQEKNKFPGDIINKIFRIVKDIAYDSLEEPYICEYDPSYKNHIEPEQMMKLNNLIDNMDIIEEILLDNSDENHCLCQKYVHECGGIYRNMNKKYCDNEEDKTIKYNVLCEELQTFQKKYVELSSEYPHIRNKLPSLDFSNNTYITGCLYTEKKRISYLDDNSAFNQVFRNLPLIVGGMMGTSVILLILYKFTPIGSLIRSRMGKNKAMDDTLYEEMNEFGSSSYQYENMNLDDMEYNMTYHPVRNSQFAYNIG